METKDIIVGSHFEMDIDGNKSIGTILRLVAENDVDGVMEYTYWIEWKSGYYGEKDNELLDLSSQQLCELVDGGNTFICDGFSVSLI